MGVNGVTQVSSNAEHFSFNETEKVSSTNGLTRDATYGKIVGQPNLSEEGLKYYNSLKAKYGDMDFVLVSKDQKDYAKKRISSYGSSSAFTVLIDDEKIERMATDEEYRKKYEGLLEMAKQELPKMKDDLLKKGSSVVSVGMQVNDNGTASYFAVVDKASKVQSERIAKKREEKQSESKNAKAKESQSWFDKHLSKIREDKKIEENEQREKIISEHLTGPSPLDKIYGNKDERYIVIVSNSYEDLRQRLEDAGYIPITNCVLSEEESKKGNIIDAKI